MGIYYRPPNQGEELDQEFLSQLMEVVRSKDVAIMGDLNFPDTLSNMFFQLVRKSVIFLCC